MEDSSSVKEDEEVASSVSHYFTEERQTQAQKQEAEELGKLWEEELNKYYGRYSGLIHLNTHDSRTIFTYFAPVRVVKVIN